MKAWWACKDINNFGDVLTEYLIKKIAGISVEHSNTDEHLLMCGSILNQSNENSIILGAGFMSEADEFNGANEIKLVRGIKSLEKLQRLGYGQNAMVGDPTIVLPYIYRPQVKKRYRVGLIPNYIEYEELKNRNTESCHVIDLTWPVEQVIDWILECDRIVSTSLHGIIVAQAYGIPSAWVKMSDKVSGDGFKFRDYISVNARNMPMFPFSGSAADTIYYHGNFENRQQVYNLLKQTLHDLF